MKETRESEGKNGFRLGRALRLVWESAPRWTIASAVLMLVQGLFPLLSLYLLKLLTDEVVAGMSAQDKEAAFGEVAFLIGLMGVVTLSSMACGALAGIIKKVQSQKVTIHVQDVLHAKSIEADLEYYENPEYYNRMHRAQQQGSHRPNSIVNGITSMGQNSISLLAMLALLFLFHWTVGIVLFMAVIPGVFVRLKYSGKIFRWQRKRTSKDRYAWYYHALLTSDTHAKEVRLFDFGPHFIRRYRELRKELNREEIRIATRRSLAELGAKTCATVALLACYGFIAYKTVHGDITLGDMVMYFGAFQRGMGYLQKMLTGMAGLYEDNLFLINFYEFLDLEAKIINPLDPVPVPNPMHAGIVMSHVNFRYPAGTRKVLDDVSLTIKPGEHVALVGENGSGKTTLVKLLCRLYDPDAGSITLDGIELSAFETTALRSSFSIIFQDFAKYHLTARENIWLGNCDLPPDHENIVKSARLSGADEVIDGLSHGYDTILGKRFEEGEEISIGQWQKVALARAFLRDSPIIIMDEPTSALDAKSEYEMFRKFHQLARGQTAVLISHRMSTVRMADRIFVLDGGKIVESGTHDELIKKGGKYASLFEMQAQHYR